MADPARKTRLSGFELLPGNRSSAAKGTPEVTRKEDAVLNRKLVCSIRGSALAIPFSLILCIVLLAACTSARAAKDSDLAGEAEAAVSRDAGGVAYTLTIASPEADSVDLSIEATCPDAEKSSFSIRRDYASLRGLDRFVANVRAFADGRPVEVRRVDLDRWEVESNRCSHLRLEYEIILSHQEVFGGDGHRPGLLELPLVGKDWAFFLGHMIFLSPDWVDKEPVHLSVDAPPGWRVVSPWSLEGDDVHVAGWDQELRSNYFAVGELEVREEEAAGMPVTVAYVGGRAEADRVEELVDELVSIVETLNRLMGRSPRPSSLVLINLHEDPSSIGGSVRRDSIILHIPAVLDDTSVSVVRGLIGHEWFHVFQRVHPAENDCQWLHEGFTDWMALVALRESGIIEHEKWLGMVESKINEAKADARRVGRQTLPQASTGFFRDPNQRRFSYSGGAALAFRLDGLLRAAGDERGLTGFLVRLFGEWADDRDTYTIDEVLELAAEHGGEAWAEEWRRLLETPGIPDLSALASDTHCRVEQREVRQVRMPIGWQGGGGRPAEVLAVAEGSYIDEAGLRPGDYLLSMSGVEIRGKADFDRALRIIEDPLRLEILRGDERLELETEPDVEEVVEKGLKCPE